MEVKQAIELGFKPIPHFTITGALIYDLGRERHLSFGCIGEPNEMLSICSTENGKVTDVVVIHNYDYDGYMTTTKLKMLINILK